MPSYSQGKEHTVAKVLATVTRAARNKVNPLYQATLLMKPSSRAIAIAIVGLSLPN